MASSGTLSSVLTPPSASHTLVSFPLRASNLHARFVSLSAVPSLQAASVTRTQERAGFIKTKITEECSEDEDDEDADEWELEIVDAIDPLLHLHPRRHRKGRRLKSLTPSANAPADTADWAERARQRALLALEARNPSAANYLKKKIEPSSDTKRLRRKKKKKLKKDDNSGVGKVQPRLSVKRIEEALRLQDDVNLEHSRATDMQPRLFAKRFEEALRLQDDEDFDSFLDANKVDRVEEDVGFDGVSYADADDDDLKDIDNIEDLPMDTNTELGTWQMNTTHGALTVSPEASTKNELVTVRERAFNRRLVDAKNALEVLEIVGNGEERVRSLGYPSLLTPLNVATALHRIARHMETSGTPKSDRLAFARKRYMAELVGRCMEVLPGCSAQGLSNIAWALSKVGGATLYFAEMDLIAKAVLPKVSEFNSQNVANTLGAYASMQHAAPTLFASLCDHALDILESFSSQELAQVLWAHAELMQPAKPLLDALDSVCLLLEKSSSGVRVASDSSAASFAEFHTSIASSGNFDPFGNASADQLANLAWSYAVLNQIHRLSFKYLWQVLESTLRQDDNRGGYGKSASSTWHLSQIHQVNLCLQYEYPHYGPTLSILSKDLAAEAWEMHKASIWVTSAYQKDVKWLLVSMGQKWVAEYTAADYSLDLALPEERIALEFDGPSHFIRNTGSPLGHTILKKRLLSNAGWRVLSISYETWEELDGETEQMNFLKELLKTNA